MIDRSDGSAGESSGSSRRQESDSDRNFTIIVHDVFHAPSFERTEAIQMKYTLIGLAIAAAAYGAGTFFEWLSKPRKAKRGGFRDWVKDPDWKKEAAAYFDARDAVTVPDDISAEEIQRMVDRLFAQKDENFNFKRLSLVGAKAVPFLLRALENSAAVTASFGDDAHFGEEKTPFERICKLLEPVSPPEAARPLIAYIDHQNPEFRKQAAQVLGGIGTPECVEPLRKALDDADEYVRCYALRGIGRGIEGKRCAKDFLDALFPAVMKDLTRDDDAPRVLLAMDAERALPILLSPEHFTVENRAVCDILCALNMVGCKIPHEKLLPFIAAVKPLSGEYPHGREYAEALTAYASNPDAAVERILRAELKSPDEYIQVTAAEALGKLAGINDARTVIYDALDHLEFEELIPHHRHYFSASRYDGEVMNGGHSQYFVNSSGRHWKDALAGLKVIGAVGKAEILREAVAVFGAAGPSTEGKVRHRQLAAFTPEQDQALEALDAKYQKCKECVGALLALYALEYKEHFVATKTEA